MMLLRRVAYLLIAASIGLALPASLGVPPPWFLLIGLFGGRLYLLTMDPYLQADRPALITSVGVWAGIHLAIGLLDARIQTLVGLPLLTLPLVYWLMTRFANLPEVWLTSSFRVTTVLMGLFSFGLLMGNSFTLLAPLCMFIIAAHLYHAFANQNGSRTLAAHWVALALILWIGVGLFGETPLVTDMRFSNGTGTQTNWLCYATLSVILGMGSQITADLRGENRRITGLSAFWLVAFGVILVGVSSLELHQVRRFLTSADENWMYNPVIIDVWDSFLMENLIWVFAIPFGLIIYLVQFVIRRPPGLLSSDSEPRRLR